MANLIILTDSKTHATVQPMYNFLVAEGHTVLLENMADWIAADLLQFDAMISFRTTHAAGAADQIISAFNQGVPLLDGMTSTISSTTSGTYNQYTPSRYLDVVNYSDTRGTTAYARIGVPTPPLLNNYQVDSTLIFPSMIGISQIEVGTPEASVIYSYISSFNTGGKFSTDVKILTNSYTADSTTLSGWYTEKGDLNRAGNALAAKLMTLMWLQCVNDYTTAVKDALRLAIEWLTSPVTYVQGVTTLDGSPISQRVVAVKADITDLKILGSAISDPSDGSYTIPLHYEGDVMVFTIQDYGDEWTASTSVSLDDYIHPAVPNGYIYKVTVAGTTGTNEPTWETEEGVTVTDGTVTYVTEILLEPKMGGYKKPVIEIL